MTTRPMYVSIPLLEMVLREGVRPAFPRDVPGDIRIVRVRAWEFPRDPLSSIEVVVASSAWPSELEGEPYKPIWVAAT